VLGVVRQLSRGGLRSRSLAVTAGATRTQIDTLKVAPNPKPQALTLTPQTLNPIT